MSRHDAHNLSKETRKDAHNVAVVSTTGHSTTGKHDMHADATGKGRDISTHATTNVHTGRNGGQVEYTCRSTVAEKHMDFAAELGEVHLQAANARKHPLREDELISRLSRRMRAFDEWRGRATAVQSATYREQGEREGMRTAQLQTIRVASRMREDRPQAP